MNIERKNGVKTKKRVLTDKAKYVNIINDGEVVELVYGTSLENWRRLIPTVGSNPTLCAK